MLGIVDVRRGMTVAGVTMLLMAVMVFAANDAAAAGKTVTISGKAYRFNHMDTPIPGATIKVRELPKISATTDANGDYELDVPNDSNVTPYILSGSIPPGTDPANEHYNEIDLQTFHPRGKDIVNANIQTPTDFEYGALKAILSVPASEDGRPEQCAIVTTSSARNVRGVDYQTFWDRTPHGVAGATSLSVPAIPGPTYFNEFVIPDKSKTSSSEDGGIIWEIVPAGTYRIMTSHPTTRFASFLATCEDGRIINANPPWGAYELAEGEKPLAASNVAASVRNVAAATTDSGPLKGRRHVLPNIVVGERVSVFAEVFKKGRRVGKKIVKKLNAGERVIWVKVNRKVKPGRATLKLKMTDASGVSYTTIRKVRIPAKRIG